VPVALVFRYTFDTAWNKAAQPLDTWFSEYAFRRYGNVANADAAKAWAILSTAVCVLNRCSTHAIATFASVVFNLLLSVVGCHPLSQL
jgi:ABC-type spermidine/putrescine transport system permease subunit II